MLVTGGAGFLGAHLARRLRELEAEVHTLDVQPLEEPNAHHITTDVLELRSEDLRSIAPDVVFHLAAVVGVEDAWADPGRTVAVNAAGTGHLLSLCRTIGTRRFCLVSSSSVYGEPESLPITETHRTHPRSVYAWSKVCAEQLVRATAESRLMHSIILRPFNIYGPGQRDGFVVTRFIKQALAGAPLTIVGSGLQRRDFTHVEDFVECALVAVAESAGIAPIYNVASGSSVTVSELARQIVDIAGSPSSVVHVGIEEVGRHPLSEIALREASIAKARTELGFEPAVDLRSGLGRTLDAMRADSQGIL